MLVQAEAFIQHAAITGLVFTEPDETMTEFVIDEPIYFRVIDDKRHHRS